MHAIASMKAEGSGRFAVALTAQENERFLTGIKDTDEYYNMLSRVNAETSECSRAADRDSIHEGIRRSVGFAKLNRMVFGVMEGWMEERLRGQVAASVAARNDAGSQDWNYTLATVLMHQGRHEEAAVIFEAVLEFRRRMLPHNSGKTGLTSLFFPFFLAIQHVSSQLVQWYTLPPHTANLGGMKMPWRCESRRSKFNDVRCIRTTRT